MKYEIKFNKELIQDLKAIQGVDAFELFWEVVTGKFLLKLKLFEFWNQELLSLKDREYTNRPETDEFKISIEWIKAE